MLIFLSSVAKSSHYHQEKSLFIHFLPIQGFLDKRILPNVIVKVLIIVAVFMGHLLLKLHLIPPTGANSDDKKKQLQHGRLPLTKD